MAAATPDFSDVPYRDKLSCLKREIEKRKAVYPGLIQAKKLSAERAAREIRTMEAIYSDYADWMFALPGGIEGARAEIERRLAVDAEAAAEASRQMRTVEARR